MSAKSTTPKVLDGKFELLSELGGGRLGKIYKARLLTSDRLVAVRILDAAPLAERKAALKLMSEIVAARSLHHRDICTILGFHSAGEHPYLVMEYVEGRTLREELARRPAGRCSMEDFRPMAASLLRALEYAHTKGVPHGNLHPGNIMIRPDGTISLLDCGIGASGSSPHPETTAPELTDGGATPSGDLFAAGATFYRTLTGVWPRTGEDSSLRPVVGAAPELNQAITACLDAEPAARPTPAQLERTLESAATPVEATPTPAPERTAAADEDADMDKAEPGAEQPKTAYHLSFSIAATLLLVFSLAVVAKRSGGAMTETLLSAAPRNEEAVGYDAVPPPPPDVTVDNRRPGEIWTSPQLGGEFAYIPAGAAIMGSPAEEAGRDADEVRHGVEISKGFWMGRREVTQREWESVMGTRPWEGKMKSHPNLPATWVTWDQVNEFIHRLNRAAEGEIYRLPSEAEWEYAVRSGGDPYAPADAAELSSSAWYRDNSNGELQPVGLKEANLWGLYDVRGNAWEWVHDWYSDYPQVSQIDPQGPTTGEYRVVRGCSFFNPASICRIANRHKVDPRSGDRHIGFRLVRESR